MTSPLTPEAVAHMVAKAEKMVSHPGGTITDPLEDLVLRLCGSLTTLAAERDEWKGYADRTAPLAKTLIRDLASAQTELDTLRTSEGALKARVKVLEGALTAINQRHIPDQPATSPSSELDWIFFQYIELRRIARAALNTGEKP